MSDASDDVELLKLQRAADFMRDVRASVNGGTLRGGRKIPQEEKSSIAAAIQESGLTSEIKKSLKPDLLIERTAERFEEMARRQGIAIEPELRPAIVKLLAAELYANHKALGIQAKDLRTLTVRHGAAGQELLQEFGELGREPIADAARSYKNPRGFLERERERRHDAAQRVNKL